MKLLLLTPRAVTMQSILPLYSTGYERLMILETLWEKANVKLFWIEGMQTWSKGKLVGLVLPMPKACYT